MVRKSNGKKGFTLIELLVVVAIIGILAAIAIPQFAKYRQSAFDSAAQSDMRNLRSDLEAYYATNFNYPVATNAWGTTDTIGDTATNPGPGINDISLSANVEYYYDGQEDGTTSTTYYSVATSNTEGTKTYGTSQDLTKIKVADTVKNDPPTAASAPTWTTEKNKARLSWFLELTVPMRLALLKPARELKEEAR